MKQIKRLLALLLVMLLLVQIPLTAMATDEPEQEPTEAADAGEEPTSEESDTPTEADPAQDTEPEAGEIEEPTEDIAESDEGSTKDVLPEEDANVEAEISTAEPMGNALVGDKVTVYQHYDTRLNLNCAGVTSSDGFPYLNTYSVNGNFEDAPRSYEIFYCIQFDVHGQPGATTTIGTDLTKTQAWIDLALNKPGAQQGITYALIYGVPNAPGYYNIYGYAATQLLIWEYEKGYRTNATVDDTVFSRTMLNNSSRLREAYVYIRNKIRAHENAPSFAGTSVTLRGIGRENAVTLTDTKGYFSNDLWRAESTNPHVTVEQSGNSLTIFANDYTDEPITLKLVRNHECQTGAALCAKTGNQTCITGVPSDPLTVRLEVKIESVKATLVKEAPEGGSKAATFRLYEGWTNYTADKYTTIQTDASGQSGTFSLKPGTSYYVEEVFEEGSPYDKDNSFQITGAAETKLTGTGHCGGKLHYFKANAGDKVTITCTNQWDMTLRIIKKSSQELVDAYAGEGRTDNVNVGIDFLVWDSLAAYHTTMQDAYAPEVPVENGLTGNTEGYRVTTTEPKEPKTEPPEETAPQGLARR